MHLSLLGSSESPPAHSPYPYPVLLNSPFAKLVQLANLETEARLKLIFCQVSKFGGLGGDGVDSDEHQSSGNADAQQGGERGEDVGGFGGWDHSTNSAFSQHRGLRSTQKL